METIEDVKASGATVLYFDGAAYMDYLLDGLLDPARSTALRRQPGGSSPRGDLVQQGFATNEIYIVRERLPDWKKPVKYLLIHDTGFDIYQSALSVKPEPSPSRRLPVQARADLPAGAGRLRHRSGADEREARRDRDRTRTFWTLSRS